MRNFNIVQPYSRITSLSSQEEGIKMLKTIESIGRVSHRSENLQTEDSYKRFIETVVMNHGDMSIIEHCNVTVEAVLNRAIANEWVRHRIGSYTQSSTRFINHAKKPQHMEFIIPFSMRDNEKRMELWEKNVSHCVEEYNEAIGNGVPPQDARDLLPHSLATKLITTYNLRNWRYFLLARSTKEAHPQIREIVDSLIVQFSSYIPILFDDIIPGNLQRAAFAKVR